MKKQKLLSWLTSEISDAGLTLTVINYLSGKTKFLTSRQIISWKEFLFIWSVQGKVFEDTKFFKKWMEPFVSMKRNKKGARQMEEVCKIIEQNSTAKDFFREKLPVVWAVELCSGVWHCFQLWRKATSIIEQHFVLDAIRKSSMISVFNYDQLQYYYEITETFPNDRHIVEALIGVLINSNTKEAYYLARKVPFTEDQINTLCVKIASEEKSRVDIDDLTDLYLRTRYQGVLDLVLKKTVDLADPEYAMDAFVRRFSNTESEKRKNLAEALFPIFYVLLDKVGFNKFETHKNTIYFMPPYKQEDDRIEEILNKIIERYTNSQYKLLYDAFLPLYSYAPKQQFVDLYMESIPLHRYKGFIGAIEVFELCKDELVIDRVISVGIPLAEYVDDDLTSFMDWLKTGGTPWYDRVKTMIMENDYLSKWCKKAFEYGGRNKEYFIKLSTHFL